MDELNPESNQTPQTDAEAPSQKDRVAELEGLLAQKDEKLNVANSRINELEQAVATLDKKLADTSNTLSQAITSYKSLAIKSNPGVDELISGNSIEEINASVEKAKALVFRVRQGIEEEATRIKVPAGAPQRKPFDLSALSPREKIKYAIGGKR